MALWSHVDTWELLQELAPQQQQQERQQAPKQQQDTKKAAAAGPAAGPAAASAAAIKRVAAELQSNTKVHADKAQLLVGQRIRVARATGGGGDGGAAAAVGAAGDGDDSSSSWQTGTLTVSVFVIFWERRVGQVGGGCPGGHCLSVPAASPTTDPSYNNNQLANQQQPPTSKPHRAM